MSAPESADQAGRVAVTLLNRCMRGDRNAVRADCERASRIARAIWRRWQVGPWQWKSKHVRWFLEHRADKFSLWTRYRYWLTIERMLHVTGKLDDWQALLKGPWRSPKSE